MPTGQTAFGETATGGHAARRAERLGERPMGKPHHNKAFTATVNRLSERYAGRANEDGEIVSALATIVVATSATAAEVIAELAKRRGPVYVAMTNQEAVRDALRIADGTRVGVMQPDGRIARPAES